MYGLEFSGLEARPLVGVKREVAQLFELDLVERNLALVGLGAGWVEREELNLGGDLILM